MAPVVQKSGSPSTEADVGTRIAEITEVAPSSSKQGLAPETVFALAR